MGIAKRGVTEDGPMMIRGKSAEKCRAFHSDFSIHALEAVYGSEQNRGLKSSWLYAVDVYILSLEAPLLSCRCRDSRLKLWQIFALLTRVSL